jgi:HYDIN/CFA65/VesB family protein
LLRDRILRAAISVALFSMLGASAQSQANSAVQSNSPSTPGGAGIALVQSTSLDASNSNWATLGFGSNNTAGNFIAVVIQGGQSGEAFTVTDSQGNTYQQAIQTNEDTAGETIAIYYATNIAGGANTVTLYQSILGSFRFAILEYSGVAKTNALDVAAAAQGASAFPSSGSVTTTANGDLLLGGVMSAGGEIYTASSGYRIEQSVPASPNTRVIAEDQTQATAGPNSAGASLSTTDFWAAVLAAFKPAGGTGSAGSSSGGASGSGSSTSPTQGQLSASTANLNFGNISVGSSGLLTDMLSNSGTANVAISNISISGAGIGTSGVYVGLVLAPGQSAALNVAFAPTAVVGVSGSVTVTSNAANSPMSIAISGAGVEQVSHSADLSWDASSGAVGYNVYRGTVSGGPYALLTGSPITITTFTDTNVQAGQSYYYAVTALNSNGVESALSNQAAATIP